MITNGINMYLNIAGGKIFPLLDKFPNFEKIEYKDRLPVLNHLMNVDLSYEYFATEIDSSIFIKGVSYHKEDIYKFLENIQISFKGIAIYRFMEHVPLKDLLYFIYLLSTVTEQGDFIDVIVPDYKLLIDKISTEDIQFTGTCEENFDYDYKFQEHDILVTTELLNEPSCPHASIWTSKRAKHYFELEKRFKIKDIKTPFSFDGRDIYLRFTAERI